LIIFEYELVKMMKALRVLLIIFIWVGITYNYGFAQRSGPGSGGSAAPVSNASSHSSTSNYSPPQNSSAHSAGSNTTQVSNSRVTNTNTNVTKTSVPIPNAKAPNRNPRIANSKIQLRNNAARTTKIEEKSRLHWFGHRNEAIVNNTCSIVYICTDNSSAEYHKSANCIELRNCTGKIKAVTEAEAIQMGKHKCPVCW